MDQFFEKYKNEIISLLLTGGLIAYLIFYNSKKNEQLQQNLKNIIIGDSQAPFIAKKSSKAILEPLLQKGGIGMKDLIGLINNYPIDSNVGNVIVVIGTNGRFNQNDPIDKLFALLKTKFPNAKFIVVKGSWGWGGNVTVTENEVNNYYKLFEKYAKIISTPIGKNEPHNPNLPAYVKISSEIDQILNK